MEKFSEGAKFRDFLERVLGGEIPESQTLFESEDENYPRTLVSTFSYSVNPGDANLSLVQARYKIDERFQILEIIEVVILED